MAIIRCDKGDVGTVVHCHPAGDIDEVEFIDERDARSSSRRFLHLVSAKGLTRDEAAVAAKAQLIEPDRRDGWTEEWQKGERAAEADRRAGRVGTRFEVVDRIRCRVPSIPERQVQSDVREALKHVRQRRRG